MEYGPAPESDASRRSPGSAEHERARSGTSSTASGSHGRAAQTFDVDQSRRPASRSPSVAAGHEQRTWTRRWRRRARRCPAWQALGGHGRARYLYALARADPEALAPARRAGDAGQRQADPRDARHRHPAGRAALLPPRRLGAADGDASCRLRAARRGRADHPLELPAADAGLEDRARRWRRATRWCSSRPSSRR